MKYDTIVVGGGSTGAVVAARLSEDPNHSVLLLEAGPDYAGVDHLPGDLANAFSVSVVDHDWHWTAEANTGRTIDYARGKVTGGCSAINGTIAVRGNPSDYDEWASWGNDQWSWQKVLPYFIKIENDQDAGGEYHGKSGPIPVVRWREEELTPLSRAFTKACLDLGYPWVEDHNDPFAGGIGMMPMNRRGSLRVSAAVGYLSPARGRSNFKICADTLATRVIFDGNRAVGVEIDQGGKKTIVNGERIILSAGSLQSPAILWRSGVGPRAELEALGVPVVLHQPNVGANLIEHSQSLVALFPRDGVCVKENPDVQMLVDYTAPGGTDGTDSADSNDMQIYCVHKLGKERFPRLEAPTGIEMLFAVMCVMNRPKSRGRLTLKSTDPGVQPVIELNLNTHPDDMRRLSDGVRRCWAIAQSRELQDLAQGVAILTQETIDSDDALARYIRENSATIWHPVGTCKMGPSTDSTAVVDQYCRVHGLQNLWVADASVFPNHTSKNPNLTCFVIGERVAEWITRDLS